MTARMIEKETIIVSFSGGRTSGYMCKWLIENMSWLYNFIFVFANTGREHENTLKFVDQCDKYFNLSLVWLEAVVTPTKGEATSYKIVNYETADRKGKPFEEMIRKYGLANKSYPHCTRELKLQPIETYKESIGLKECRNAVGIRYDEFHRVKNNKALIYPLATIIKTSKKDVLEFWEKMPFDLELEEHYGNCVECFKKSDKKLKMIADENPHYFDFTIEMEEKYSNVITNEDAGIRKIYRHQRTAFEVRNNINLPESLTEKEECAEECGSVISDYISKEAQYNLFAQTN